MDTRNKPTYHTRTNTMYANNANQSMGYGYGKNAYGVLKLIATLPPNTLIDTHTVFAARPF